MSLNRKFVIAEFDVDNLQETEDWLNEYYPFHTIVSVYYYQKGSAHRVRLRKK